MSMEERIAISVTYRRGRITIHKSVIRALSNPQYIRIIVNPERKLLGIQACTFAEKRSFKVPQQFTTSPTQKFEIRSDEMLRKILQCAEIEDESKRYIFLGDLVPNERMALFDLGTVHHSVQKDK